MPHIARGGGVAEGGLRPPNRHRAPTEGEPVTLARPKLGVPPSSVMFTWLFSSRARLAPSGGPPPAPGFAASRWLPGGISLN